MLKTKISWVLLPILFFSFSLGIFELFDLRFRRGDIYPVYSSLRADPLGTKAFYEGLEKISGVSVSRNYRPFRELKDDEGTTFFYFGMKYPILLKDDDARTLESIARNGGRVIVLLYPEKLPETAGKQSGTGEDRDGVGAGRQRKQEKSCDAQTVSLSERWNFSLNSDPLPSGGDRRAMPVSYRDVLTGRVSWHSPLYFVKKDGWEDVYEVESRAVLIEKKLGKGSIVLSSDTFFVSNEAMRKERHPALLAWLIGKNAKVVFDETHLGIRENPGITALARRYRLHGLYAGIALLAVLFVWKNAFSLVPQRENTTDAGGVISGKDSISGLAGLLRRAVAPADIIPACFSEWQRTHRFGRKVPEEELGKIREIVESVRGRPARQCDPIETYRRISEILSERKRKWKRN